MNFWKVYEGKTLLRCGKCAFAMFQPEDYHTETITKQYEENQTSPVQYYEATRKDDLFNFHRRLTLLEKAGIKGSVLDVGCSVGHFLEAAKERGWEAEGIEANPLAAQKATEKGFKAHRGFFNADFVNHCQKRFHAIHMGDVIEHVFEPWLLIRYAQKLLYPGGALMIVTPDIESWIARQFQIKPQEHLVYFSRYSLDTLLQKESFHIHRSCRWSRLRTIEALDRGTTFSDTGKKFISCLRTFGLSSMVGQFLFHFTRDEILVLATAPEVA